MALALLAILLSLVDMSKAPKLPKPTLGCPDCRDATLAAVKENP